MSNFEAPLISVVMSVYNDSKFLNTAIQSILDQTFKDFEFIIIDDGSTDNSQAIIERFTNVDSRVRFYKNKTNKGLAYSLNKGISLSIGKYIARMDADDISILDRFEKQLSYFNMNPQTDVLGTGAILIDENNFELGKKIMPSSNKEMKKHLYFNSCFFHPSVMAKKSFFLPNNLYNEKLMRSQDWFLWVDNFDKYKYSNINEFLLKYRVNTSSTSSLYWNIKVLFLQGFKRKEFMAILGVILLCYQYLYKKHV